MSRHVAPSPSPRRPHRHSVLTVLAASALLIVASTGGAVAGSMITGKQIKDGTVTGKDIRNQNLTGLDVKDRSLTGADLLDGSLSGKDIGKNAIGEANLAPGVRTGLNTVVSGVVNAAGELIVVQTREGVGVESAKLNTGSYCVEIDGLTPANSAMVATPDFSSSPTSTVAGSLGTVEVQRSGASCQHGFVVYVFKHTGTTVTVANGGFSFMVR